MIFLFFFLLFFFFLRAPPIFPFGLALSNASTQDVRAISCGETVEEHNFVS